MPASSPIAARRGRGVMDWQQCSERLEAIRNLDDGWDDHDALAVDSALIAFSKRTLVRLEKQGHAPPSRIVPTPMGTVVIEWQSSDLYAEVELVAVGTLEWMFEYPDGHFEHCTDRSTQ